MGGGWVYIVTNRPNGTLYVGVTGDLARRTYEHREGQIDGFTKRYGLKRLVYYERFDDIRDAIRREQALKHWSRAWKGKLIRAIRPMVPGIAGAGTRAGLTSPGADELVDSNMTKGGAMPGNLHVRNLDDDLIARLKRRAARHGRSAEAEHREILRQALAAEVEPSFDDLAAELRKLTRRRKQTPSEALLREGRDER
jgi:predicted GIY-YIG superfamily endonuclease/plasmid stability protein